MNEYEGSTNNELDGLHPYEKEIKFIWLYFLNDRIISTRSSLTLTALSYNGAYFSEKT